MKTTFNSMKKYSVFIAFALVASNAAAQQACTVAGVSAYTTRKDLDDATKERMLQVVQTYVQNAKKYVDEKIPLLTAADTKCSGQTKSVLDALNQLVQDNGPFIKKCYLGYKRGTCSHAEIVQLDQILKKYEAAFKVVNKACVDSLAQTSTGTQGGLKVVQNAFCDYIQAAAENTLPTMLIPTEEKAGLPDNVLTEENHLDVPAVSSPYVIGPVKAFLTGSVLVGIGVWIYFTQGKSACGEAADGVAKQ